MTSTQQRFHSILSQSGWQRFITKLQGYRDRGQPFPVTVTLRDPTDDERLHHARLMRTGIQPRGGSLRYDLEKLSVALANGDSMPTWDEVLTLLRGPVTQELLAARFAKQAWENLWARAEAGVAMAPFEQWEEWLSALKRDGSLKRVSKGDPTEAWSFIELAANLLRVLPFAVERSLAGVAAEFCGNSHALDASTPMSTLVLRALSLRLKQVFPARSDARREVWAAFGVVCDELSAPVLVFNLDVTGGGILSQLTSVAAAGNQPLHLTTRVIWSSDWSSINCPSYIYVCENPTVISIAANRFAHKCPSLICVNGEPSAAARALMRKLKAGGAELCYHGDFDWAGVAIAKRVMEEFDAVPWSFDVDAYRLASRFLGRELIDTPVSTPWSPELSKEMQDRGVAYDEEVLAHDLLAEVCVGS